MFFDEKENIAHKWSHYFPIYEKHFSKWRNQSLTFLEIGVSKGGSVNMWSKYFGPMSKVIGVDINPDCKKFEKRNISIRIGDQSNKDFLQSIINEFGVPDVVLDDGSHIQSDINTTFEFLYPLMGKNSIYMIEDLHTSYYPTYGGGLENPNTFINKSKNYIDQLNINHTSGQLKRNELLKNTFSISYYDSITVFEKGIPFEYKDILSNS